MDIRVVTFGSVQHAETLALRREVLGEPDRPDWSAEEVERERGDDHVGLYDGERLLGCLVLTPWSGALLQVRQVSVRLDDRRRGFGRALMALAERMAQERGCRYVGLYARPEAVEFYRALGYRYCEEWPAEAGIPPQMTAKAIG